MRGNLIVRDPFRDFDAIVRRSFAPVTTPTTSPSFVPAVESHRDGDDAVVRVDLPGVDVDNDVQVEVLDGRLVISGSRRDARAQQDGGQGQTRRLSEVRYGTFKRTFRLGSQVGAEAVSASYDAGVLTVRVGGAFARPEGQRISISTQGTATAQSVVESETTEGGSVDGQATQA